MDNYEAAKGYLEQGYSVIPVKDKEPMVRWKQYVDRRPTGDELKYWFWDYFRDTRYGVAAVCGRLSNLTVLDADSPRAEGWVSQNANTEEIVSTPSGGSHYHFEYKDYPNKVNLFGIDLDVRSQGGLAVLPPTTNYEWVSNGTRGKLGDILPAIEPVKIQGEVPRGNSVENTLAYLTKLDPAISGSGGQRKLYRACCVVADRLARSIEPEQALPVLLEWNSRCEPPWSEAELMHSLRNAWRR